MFTAAADKPEYFDCCLPEGCKSLVELFAFPAHAAVAEAAFAAVEDPSDAC